MDLSMGLSMGNSHRNKLPTDNLLGLWLGPDLVDSIGESFSVMYAQLPAEHQSLYSADGITPYDNATTVANIAGYVGLNEGELIGNAEKGYAQYADGTSRYILNKGLRYFGEPIVAPTVFDRYFNTSHYTGWENYA